MMKLKTKTGFEIEVEIAGTQEEPVITVTPFKASGRTIGGPANIQHWKSKGLEEGLYCATGDAYFQMAAAMPTIREAIAGLPHKIYMARKVTEIVNLDGDRCPVTRWQFECLITSPKTGEIIGAESMARFLNSIGVSEMEITEAARLWSETNETPEKLAKRAEESEKFAVIQRHWIDMEEMENGGRALEDKRDPTPAHPREGW